MATIKLILKHKRYFLLAFISGLVLFGGWYYLLLLNVAGHNLATYVDLNGLWYTIITMVTGTLMAIFFGIYLALLLFRHDLKQKNKSLGTGASSLGGVLVGVVTAGCPVCGVPLLGWLGAPLALMVLPLKGLEVRVIGVALLVIAIYFINKSINKQLSCELTK